MKLHEHKNSKKQGDAGLGVAIGWFAANGVTVCVPLTDSQSYDLIVDDGRLRRVQVKTTSHRNSDGRFRVELRTKGGNRSGIGKTKVLDPSQIDEVFIVTSDNDLFRIPADMLAGTSTISLGSRHEKFRVTTGG